MLFGVWQTDANQRKILHTLHLFYVGVFGLVLPFICWGAQATPGHPHALAHFVFAQPPKAALAAAVHLDATAYLAIFGQHDLCTTQQTTAPYHRAAETPQLPPGRSIPSLMVSLVLLLVMLTTSSLSPTTNRPYHLFHRQHLFPDSFTPIIPTPPPR